MEMLAMCGVGAMSVGCWASALLLGLLVVSYAVGGEAIPLPEHPRPDFQREPWMNLNGPWGFRIDNDDVGEKERWFAGQPEFPLTITVPFPWGSKLSGVPADGDLGWYARTIQVPESWRGKRVYLVLGACDWLTAAWLDGEPVGSYRGGYTPAVFDLTAAVRVGKEQRLVLRVDDRRQPFKLEGKQGYGQVKGIWQTAYLEARPAVHLRSIQFLPDIDAGQVLVKASLNELAPADCQLALRFKTGGVPEARQSIVKGSREVEFTIPVPEARLWSLEDPFLYEVDAVLRSGLADEEDVVSTYFGMRKISVMRLPGIGFPYIALNNRPIYLKMALDQSYHAEGFYTFPSDQFMRDEILRARRVGLNALRLHVKIDVPRKLYWADRLGLLLMADVPNSWGEPTTEMRQEIETALRGMIERDFNHPSIFSWVPFNETWGLMDKDKRYQPQTQQWVAAMYRLAKSMDPTRLVEDNSPCNRDHVVTDINSWHVYLPGYRWREFLDHVTRDTFPGSKWNFIGDHVQREQPLLNSECGNVWGYEGSTGDVDWSWDYHIMMNEFRRHPKVCGWLYTELHDVINEWNGYYRYDRSDKDTGLGDVMPRMTLQDLHSAFYLAVGDELCVEVKPGAKVTVPLWASCMTDESPGRQFVLKTEVFGWNNLGQREVFSQSQMPLAFGPWMSQAIEPLEVTMPNHPALVVLGLTLEDGTGTALHRNFACFLVSDGPSPRDESAVAPSGQRVRHLRIAPASFHSAQWTLKQWNVLDGLKVNGAGAGHFEYCIPWPEALDVRNIEAATFRIELSAKQLFGKDVEGSTLGREGDIVRGRGTQDPSRNANAYPMTDTVRFPSAVRIRVGGVAVGVFDLPDDPADHRGVLSWHAQKRDNRLREAGSYGYLVSATVPQATLERSAATGQIVIRLEVDHSLPGGLAIYGERFGRYPLDPTLSFVLKQ